MATLIIDHPAWTTHNDGTATRAVQVNGAARSARWTGTDLEGNDHAGAAR